jgi:DnaJ-class molecular chaperone
VKFVEIGQAYETLRDDQRRAQYDGALRSARGQVFSSNAPTQSYESYRDAFDETVAGLSEEELAAALGVISIVGSLIGSIVGSRLGNNSTGGRLLSTAGSLVGSALTSRMAGEAFVSLHQESIARVAYRRECQRCVEQGMPMPEPPPVSKWQRALEKTVSSVKDQVSRGSQTATSRQWF